MLSKHRPIDESSASPMRIRLNGEGQRVAIQLDRIHAAAGAADVVGDFDLVCPQHRTDPQTIERRRNHRI